MLVLKNKERKEEKNNEVAYLDFSRYFLNDMIKIADSRFGENYIKEKEILKNVETENEMCKLAVNKINGRLLGYCLFYDEDINTAEKTFKIPKEELIQVSGSSDNICHLKSLAISKDVEKSGIGQNLFGSCLEKAENLDFSAGWCPAWKRGNYVPAARILNLYGFKPYKTVSNLWFDDKEYKCIECKGPCVCECDVYFKKLK